MPLFYFFRDIIQTFHTHVHMTLVTYPHTYSFSFVTLVSCTHDDEHTERYQGIVCTLKGMCLIPNLLTLSTHDHMYYNYHHHHHD